MIRKIASLAQGKTEGACIGCTKPVSAHAYSPRPFTCSKACRSDYDSLLRVRSNKGSR